MVSGVGDAPESGTLSVDTDDTDRFSELDSSEREALLRELVHSDPPAAAAVLRHVEDAEAAAMLGALPPVEAARIVEFMASNDRADVLGRLEEEAVAAILAELETKEAADTRANLLHPSDTAGGLMITEFLAFDADRRIADIIADMQEHGEEYAQYEVRYIYAVDACGRFLGHVSVRNLLMTHHTARLRDVGVKNVEPVRVDATVEELEPKLEVAEHFALPVVDQEGKLVGVVTRAAVEEARKEEQVEMLLKFGGIVGGEEVRSMSVLPRAARRMAFLLPNIFLSYLAVSVIALFEPMIEKLTALAVVLPMVANLTGAAGNQAVAVSIRELSLRLIRPGAVLRVWRQEILVGLLNGIVIGALLALVTYLTRGHALLSLAVGSAYATSCVFAVLLGGSLPLLLARLGVDPAMLSSPILTTLTDMTAFFLTLSIAATLLASGFAL